MASDILSENILSKINEGVIKDYLEEILPKVLSFVWCVILALIAFFIGRWIINFVRRLVRRAMKRHNAETGVMQFTDSLLRVLLYIVLAVVILHLFGIETSSVAAAVASAGLTLGLALQGSLSNFAGGVLILILHPFRVGDYIIEDTHKNEGTVIEISIFYTKLKTIDNKIIVIPNGTLANSSLTNATKSDRRQLTLVIPISYEDDIKKAKSILEDIARKETKRLPNEDVCVFVNELAASSVDLGMRFWVSTEDYWEVRWRTLELVKYAFDDAGITIPYQQMEVSVRRE